MFENTLSFFNENAASLAIDYRKADRAHMHADLLAQLPVSGKELSVLDIGAGSGETAAMFASMGHNVTAVEPARGLMEIAKSVFADKRVQWRDDSLPKLRTIVDEHVKYDVVVMSGVLQFLDGQRRQQSLKNVFSLVADEGIVEIQYPLQVPNKYQEISDSEIEEIIEKFNTHPKAQSTFEVISDKIAEDHLGRSTIKGDPLTFRTIVLKKRAL